MAKRRMFSRDVVDTDMFYSLDKSAQVLYFDLGLHADDDGFVSAPRAVMKGAGCKPKDMHELEAKGYIHSFDSGICHMTHWLQNNQIRRDRYTPTVYVKEKNELTQQHIGKLFFDDMS